MWKFAVFFMLVWCNAVGAQISFPSQFASWCYSGYGDGNQPREPLCIAPQRTDTINNLEYTQIYFRRHPDLNMERLWYRSEDRKFYVLPQDSSQEILVYDFNLSIGDSFSTNWGWPLDETITLFVREIDTITTVDGIARKRMILENNHFYGSWLEGIGSLQWVFVYPAYKGSVSGGYGFTCHSFENEVLYPFEVDPSYFCGFVSTKQSDLETKMVVSPNPVQDVLYLKNLINIHQIRILNSDSKVIYQTNMVLETDAMSLPFGFCEVFYFVQAISKEGKISTVKVLK